MSIRSDEIVSSYEFELIEEIRRLEKKLDRKNFHLKKLQDELKSLEKSEAEEINHIEIIMTMSTIIGGMWLCYLGMFGIDWEITRLGLIPFSIGAIYFFISVIRGEKSIQPVIQFITWSRREHKLSSEIRKLKKQIVMAKMDYNRYRSKVRDQNKKSSKSKKSLFSDLNGSKSKITNIRTHSEKNKSKFRCVICYKTIIEKSNYLYSCCDIMVHIRHFKNKSLARRCPFCKQNNTLLAYNGDNRISYL